MPGLFGIVKLAAAAAPAWERIDQLFRRMASCLMHLPDYALDRWDQPVAGVWLGRIGLPWHQPMSWNRVQGHGERVTRAFFAGEERGAAPFDPAGTTQTASLSAYRGFYAVACHEGAPAATVIAADRRASVPIFYTIAGNLLLFAPEIKALLEHEGVAKDVDLGAMGSFLVGGHVLGGDTLFRNVRRLRGGQALHVADGRVTLQTYWRFSPGAKVEHCTDVELEVELGRLVRQGVTCNLGDPDATVLSLSGGTDSRGVLGGAVDAVGGDGARLNSMSWGDTPGPAESDAGVAAQLAATLGMSHRFLRRDLDHYRADFQRVNFLLDSVSDIAANHACQHRMAATLRRAGFKRMLRGDHAFGWNYPPGDIHAALSLIRLRRVGDSSGLLPFVRSAMRSHLCAASDACLDAAAEEARDMSPVDAKDFFQFSHRFQNYLQSASYYKRVILEHRNPLLDESILDFLATVPCHLRVHKLLFRKAMQRAYPQLWQIPLATMDNIENWGTLLGTDTPVRAFALAELADASSGIWGYFDRAALAATLQGHIERTAQERHTLGRRALSVWRSVVGALPDGMVRPFRRRRRAKAGFRVTTENLIFRVLALKNWHDTFVTERFNSGQGRRAA